MISRLSALIIATNDTEIIINGPNEHGRFQGMITHSRNNPHHPYMPILSSEFTFVTEDAARNGMEETIKQIKEAVNE